AASLHYYSASFSLILSSIPSFVALKYRLRRINWPEKYEPNKLHQQAPGYLPPVQNGITSRRVPQRNQRLESGNIRITARRRATVLCKLLQSTPRRRAFSAVGRKERHQTSQSITTNVSSKPLLWRGNE